MNDYRLGKKADEIKNEVDRVISDLVDRIEELEKENDFYKRKVEEFEQEIEELKTKVNHPQTLNHL